MAGFNPRAPRGARRPVTYSTLSNQVFQSTRPTRGATLAEWGNAESGRVSIHAPHAGRDPGQRAIRGRGERFNPRAPRGARPPKAKLAWPHLWFQSTRPTRGATCCYSSRAGRRQVSIHAPHAGRDRAQKCPTRPCFVSIHAPHAGRDTSSATH